MATTTARGRVRSSIGERVYTVGAEGKLHCLELATGKVVWKRDLRAEYKVPQDFFGTASTPLVEGRLLIVNVGAPGGPCVVGLDKTTGREVWRAGKEWGPSYASPVPATIHGKRRVFVFAGGESDPPTGGLMSIDPATGHVDFVFPWRSRTHESVNASCPVVFDNKVFISASYRTGSALVEVRPDFTHRVVWTTQEFGLHFNTAIYRDGYLYGFDGRNEPDASLACVDAATGKWSGGRRRNGPRPSRPRGAGGSNWLGTYRGSLLAADGQFLCLGEMGHLLWMDLTPSGYKQMSRALAVSGARVVGASGPQPRPALRRAEHPRPVPGNRSAAAVLRPAGFPAENAIVPSTGGARRGGRSVATSDTDRSSRVGRRKIVLM